MKPRLRAESAGVVWGFEEREKERRVDDFRYLSRKTNEYIFSFRWVRYRRLSSKMRFSMDVMIQWPGEMTVLRGVVYMLKRIGTRTEPWGT